MIWNARPIFMANLDSLFTSSSFAPPISHAKDTVAVTSGKRGRITVRPHAYFYNYYTHKEDQSKGSSRSCAQGVTYEYINCSADEEAKQDEAHNEALYRIHHTSRQCSIRARLKMT